MKAQKNGRTVKGKATLKNGHITIEGESARMLREASEITGEPPAILFAACVKRYAAHLRAQEKGPLTEQEKISALWELSEPTITVARREELLARLIPLSKSRDEAYFEVPLKVELHFDDWIALGKLARVCQFDDDSKPLEQWAGAIREATISRFTAKELAMMAEGDGIDGVWGIQRMIDGAREMNAERKAVAK